ncbi:MAG TPA: M20/M25/M40 family metallo-hydrolase [Gemmatimonadales bacterium]|nr:M20/M25/M40 family metallo-hydrolase [Gemmatimonadales bacterium]
MRTLTRSLATALCLALPAAAQAQQAAPVSRVLQALSASTWTAHTRYLSDDLLEGRAPATRGGLLAARYIAAQFERLGLEPAGDSGSWYHRIPVITHLPAPAFTVTAPTAMPLGYKTDYVAWAMRNDTLVHTTAPVVFAGYGITAPEWDWADFDGVDVKGKIVLVLVNDPGLRDSTIFRGRELTYYGRWTYKIEEAARQGAAGVLFVHTDTSATYGWSTVVGSWTGQQVRLETPPTSLLFAGWLTEGTARRLLASAGQDLDSLTARATRRGFRALPLGVTLDATVQSQVARSETYNVVARLPGRGPHRAEAVLIGGHYDHLGIGPAVDGDSIYNGALDNASGTAAVLTLAEAFARSGVRPDRSLLFIAFGAEESGLLGSGAFAERPTLPLRDLAAVINLDESVVYGRTRDIAALGTDQSSLGPVFTAAARAEGLRLSVDPGAAAGGFFFRSDHFPFVRAGVPSLSLEQGKDFVGHPAGWGAEMARTYGEKRYHQPADEFGPEFTPDGTIQELRVVARTVMSVANAPRQPTWNANSEFRAAGEARVR